MNFPIRWLTYKQRISDDVKAILGNEDASDFFDGDYLSALSTQIKQQEEWLLKIFALQMAIITFLLIGYVSPDTKLSIFGVDLKGIQGSREMLLLLSSALGTFTCMIAASRDAAVYLAEAILQHNEASGLKPFKAFVAPSVFNVRLYLPREYDRWMFAIIPTKIFILPAAICLVVMAIIILSGSFAIHWVLIREIWVNPSLGKWSIATLVFVFASYFVNLVILIRIAVPLPYSDKGALKKPGPWGPDTQSGVR
jgi:hypothetical protein